MFTKDTLLSINLVGRGLVMGLGLILVGVLVGVVFFKVCGSKSLDKDMTPEEVVQAFLRAVEKGDLETIEAVHDPAVWKDIAPIWDGKPSVKYSKMSIRVKKSDDGLRAVAMLQNVKDDSDWDIISLRKMDEGWRITYEKPFAFKLKFN